MADDVELVFHLIQGRIEPVHYELLEQLRATGVPVSVEHEPEPVPKSGGPGTTIVLDLLLKAAEGGAATMGGLAVKAALDRIAPVVKRFRHRLVVFSITVRRGKNQKVGYTATPSPEGDWSEALDKIAEDFAQQSSDVHDNRRFWYPEDETWDSWRGYWGGQKPKV